MSLNQPTLIEFEIERRNTNTIPPEGSNSFYEIGNGTINLFVFRSDPFDYRFDLYTNSNEIHIGSGNFLIAGDNHNIEKPYRNFTVISNTKCIVDNMITVESGLFEVFGELELDSYSTLVIRNNGNVILYPESIFTIRNDCKILIEEGSSLTIYGTINIHIDSIDNLMKTNGILVDSSVIMNVDGMDALGKRDYSLTDYDSYLRNQNINKNTQGSIDTNTGRIGYTWLDGKPLHHSQLLRISILYGYAILGDFNYSILGIPEYLPSEYQQIAELIVEKNTILKITDSNNDYRYINPNLYIGIIEGNTKIPGKCIIKGKVEVSGRNSSITLDRGGNLVIEENAELWLKNDANLFCTEVNENTPVLFVNGTLYMDDINQIVTFQHDNILLGNKGKIVIYNPTKSESRILFSTPNQIEDSDIYRLFKDRIDHIEFHVSENTGIIIDQYYEYYHKDFTNWFGNRRFEKAIEDGILVWHDHAFIELHSSVIPWAKLDSTLFQASRLFKSSGSTDEEKLQEVVNHLSYIGCGNITFKFINDTNKMYSTITLVLNPIHMEHIIRYPVNDTYILTTDNTGELFIKNKVNHPIESEIIHPNARQISLNDTKTEFYIE